MQSLATTVGSSDAVTEVETSSANDGLLGILYHTLFHPEADMAMICTLSSLFHFVEVSRISSR